MVGIFLPTMVSVEAIPRRVPTRLSSYSSARQVTKGKKLLTGEFWESEYLEIGGNSEYRSNS